MRADLLAWAASRGGVITRRAALTWFPTHVVDDALQDGVIVRLLPSTYAQPHLLGDRTVLRRAALLYRPDAALAGLDALDIWGVMGGGLASGPIRMVTDEGHREAKVPALRVTRRRGFCNRRIPAIVAVRERRTTGDRLLDALTRSGRVQGASAMRESFSLIAGGCHSPLELWGHQRVFNVGELRHANLQHRVEPSTGVVYLDRFYEEVMCDLELDGAAYHGAPGQRERDIRRDAELAARGIQTIRFSHLRLFREPEAVRRETLAVFAARRRQLGPRPA